jgi:hypothetical protein
VTGHQLALFNGCIVTGWVTAEELDAAIRWIRQRYVPFRIWIDEPLGADGAPAATRYVEVLADHSLVAHGHPLPGMVLHPLPDPVTHASGLTVRTVDPADPAALAEHHGVWADGGLPLEIVVQIISAAFATNADVRLFTGYLEGRPVATSIAIRSGDVSGIYGVGTIEAARRRGLGNGRLVGRGRGRPRVGLRHDRAPGDRDGGCRCIGQWASGPSCRTRPSADATRSPRARAASSRRPA